MKVSHILSVVSFIALLTAVSTEGKAVCTSACKDAVFGSETYKNLVAHFHKSTNPHPDAEFITGFAFHYASLQQQPVCQECSVEEILTMVDIPKR